MQKAEAWIPYISSSVDTFSRTSSILVSTPLLQVGMKAFQFVLMLKSTAGVTTPVILRSKVKFRSKSAGRARVNEENREKIH